MDIGRYVAAFDFDGVIWNSVDECLYIASRVYGRMEGDFAVDSQILKNRFRKGRYLVKKGEDFYHLMGLVLDRTIEDLENIDYRIFLDMRKKHHNRALEFGEEFYLERKHLRTNHNRFWKSLQRPFDGVLKSLRSFKDRFRQFLICTTKDEESVKNLLSDENFHIPVFGREISTHKPDLIDKICTTYGVEPKEIIFIDDLPENLIAVKKTGAAVAMAGWGYNNEAGRRMMRESGVAVLTAEMLAEDIMEVIRCHSENPNDKIL